MMPKSESKTPADKDSVKGPLEEACDGLWKL